METLIIFLGVFLPVGWGIWRLVRVTRDTIGTNSPVKVKRIYQAGTWDFFVNFDTVILGLFGITAPFFLRSAFTIQVSPEDFHPWVGRLMLFALGCLLIGMNLFIISITLNHWKYADGVVIETFPDKHELEITFGDSKRRLKEGDISRVLVTSNEAKMRITFMTYYLTNGDHFILPEKMPGAWVIQEYFKKVPTEFKRKRFPFIQ